MEDCLLYVGTDTRCHAYELRDGETTKVDADLDGNAVRRISVHPDDPEEALVACGLRGWGLHRTRNAGESWESLGFEESWVWGVERDPTDPDTVYVGTEPPMLYRSRDGGESFAAFDAISNLPSSDQWTFFHEPFEAGHVHGIAIDPEDPDRVFAGVEHGGFVFTHDGGATWDDSLAGYDVHDTAVVPGTDRVLVAAGEGLLVSDDNGEEFDQMVGFEDNYVEQFLEVGDRIYVDATAGSGSADATIAYTDDGGDSWVPVGPSHGKIRAITAAPLP